MRLSLVVSISRAIFGVFRRFVLPLKMRFDFSKFYPVLNVLLLLSVVANFIVIFFFERSRKPQVVHSVETVVSNHYNVVTNYVTSLRDLLTDNDSSSTSLSSFSVSNVLSRSDNSVTVRYRYFIANVPCFEYLGEFYKEGSETSYGVVSKVFPDRVLLENGIWLVNRQEKEIAGNGRISDNATGR